MANLPDIVENRSDQKSDRLEKMVRKRREKHDRIISTFHASLSAEMSKFDEKIEQLLMALRSKLNLNRGDIEMSVYAFDDEEKLAVTTEQEFADTWALCKSMNASNLDAISRFRDAYFQVQKVQTEKLQARVSAKIF